MKFIFLKAFFIINAILVQRVSYAQCCHVFTSNGSAVVTSNGTCVTLSYPDESCIGADRDKDGIKDLEDLCPDDMGARNNGGCPEITVEIWTSFYLALSDVNFAINSDSLAPSSYPSLDKVADLMKSNKGFILKIGGFTDSTGTKAHNKKLAASRANAVRNYLIVNEKINPKRVQRASYGEKLPKALNTTTSGRAINRRVEFDIFY